MIRPSFPAAVAFCVTTLTAASPALAECAEGAACWAVQGCVHQSGEWFEGTLEGEHDGPAEVSWPGGPTCTGVWDDEDDFAKRDTVMDCDDGDRLVIIFHYENRDTGTISGQGVNANDETIHAFTGPDLPLHFIEEDHLSFARGLCGSEPPQG